MAAQYTTTGTDPLDLAEDIQRIAAHINIVDSEVVARLVQEIAAKRSGRSIPAEWLPEDRTTVAPYKAPTRITGRPHLTPQATTVLEKRYFKKDLQGRVVENAEGMFRRVARNLADAEYLYDAQADIAGWAEEFYHLMASLDFLP